MSWRPGAPAIAIAALALLAVAALAPLAAADHAYSHRYIVYGRVVDANSNPVPGLTVDLGYEPPFEPEGPCANQPGTETEAFGPTRNSPITNAFGEFMFCFHTHAMSRTTPGSGIIRIEALDIEQTFGFDGFMRYSFVPVKLADTHPAANTTAADTTYTIQGRAWEPSGQAISVESVRVYGNTLHDRPVQITFSYNGNEPITINTTTNNYGDFAVRVPVTSRPTTGEVTIEIDNHTFAGAVDPQYGTTSIRAEAPEPRDPFVTKALIGVGIAAAVVVGGGAVWYTTNKVRAAREERIARERSTRKRANK